MISALAYFGVIASESPIFVSRVIPLHIPFHFSLLHGMPHRVDIRIKSSYMSISKFPVIAS
jgi:hypothetical protein